MANPHFARAKPRPVLRSGLRALVPSSYRAEGEPHPFLKAYKEKWLSKLDFASDVSVESLLLLCFLVLAEGSPGRAGEAEAIADILIKHVDLKEAGTARRRSILTALFLSSYLKSKRGVDPGKQLARAFALSRYFTVHDREWLSAEAPREIRDALERRKPTYLLPPFGGIAYWLNDPAARRRAEEVLGEGLAAAAALMR